MDRIVLRRPRPNVLQLRRLDRRKARDAVFFALFLAVWCVAPFLRGSVRGALTGAWQTWAYVAVTLVLVLRLIWFVRTDLVGRAYEFDGVSRTVRKAGRDVARFGGIRRVQLRTIHVPAGANEHRLSLVLGDGFKLSLAHTQEEARAEQAAREIAGFVGVGIVRK